MVKLKKHESGVTYEFIAGDTREVLTTINLVTLRVLLDKHLSIFDIL